LRMCAKLKIVYSPRYCEVYSRDPAAIPGRVEAICDSLEGRFPFLEPEPATETDLLLVHSTHHIASIKRDSYLYEMALLAAGGALLTARTAFEHEPCFGLIRPPGHHASPDDCWGFCFFNNLAVSLRALAVSGAVKKAVIEADYTRLGEIARDYAGAYCGERRYALLEGGYNHDVLGKHVLAFLEGFA
jgi:acetoin utilization deacetylase AcuC-like enzyme